jgi:hypothetical protein
MTPETVEKTNIHLITLVQIFDKKDRMLQMWPTEELYEGDLEVYKNQIIETKCKPIFDRHPEYKPKDLQVYLTVAE